MLTNLQEKKTRWGSVGVKLQSPRPGSIYFVLWQMVTVNKREDLHVVLIQVCCFILVIPTIIRGSLLVTLHYLCIIQSLGSFLWYVVPLDTQMNIVNLNWEPGAWAEKFIWQFMKA